jgi:hypothetical protein
MIPEGRDGLAQTPRLRRRGSGRLCEWGTMSSRIRLRQAALLAPAALAGCSAAPSQNILGSYFPSWMLCALAGVGITIVLRQIFVAAGLDKALPAPLLVYLAFTVAFAFATWLIWLD